MDQRVEPGGRAGGERRVERTEVAIVGGGLAGLACAVHLTEAGLRCRILEASDGVGGRVRSDRRDGFVLDRGLQVLSEAYPEARRMLDYDRLELRRFEPGALVRVGAGFYRVTDPFRRPLSALATLRNPVGRRLDKLRMLRLRRRARRGELFTGRETSVQEALRELRFSDGMIDAFFRPFVGGILLEPQLGSSSYLLDFVFRWMSRGEVALPARGMGAIPEQLADRLPEGTIEPGRKVHAVVPASAGRGAQAVLDGGDRVEADALVVATEGPEAARLLEEAGADGIEDPGSRSAVCFYFAAPEPPIEGPWLVVSGEREDLVRNFAVLSQVAPEYAPPGAHLVSATVLGGGSATVGLDNAKLESAVHHQLTDWFGNQVDDWQRLAVYRIPHAQPAQPPGFRRRCALGPRIAEGLYAAGDWLDNASIDGALASGRRAATAVLGREPG